MPGDIVLNGQQRAALHAVLMYDFFEYERLELALDFQCGKRLRSFASSSLGQDSVVFKVLQDATARGWLGCLIALAMTTNVNNPHLATFANALSQMPAADNSEWCHRMILAERCVCRIEGASAQPFGTGFLVGPDLLLTCRHVIDEITAQGLAMTDARLRFDYQKGSAGEVHSIAADWRVASCPEDQLDYMLLRIDGRPGDVRGRLTPSDTPIGFHEPIFILQHPGGDTLTPRGGQVDAILATRIVYSLETEPGSSGGPCFDIAWRLVAMHRAENGDVKEGVPIAPIRHEITRRVDASVKAELGW